MTIGNILRIISIVYETISIMTTIITPVISVYFIIKKFKTFIIYSRMQNETKNNMEDPIIKYPQAIKPITGKDIINMVIQKHKPIVERLMQYSIQDIFDLAAEEISKGNLKFNVANNTISDEVIDGVMDVSRFVIKRLYKYSRSCLLFWVPKSIYKGKKVLTGETKIRMMKKREANKIKNSV